MFILFEAIATAREKRQPLFLTFIDVRKAYDRVWRTGLWHKLGDKGISQIYATIWNNVHEMTRCIKDRKMFSFMLKLDLLQKQSTDNRIFTH